jgi:hypothetical protein
MHHLRGPELPDPEGNPRRRAAGAEKILPPGTEAHTPQGIAEEVMDRIEIESAGAAGGDRYRLVRPLMVGYREVQVK